jgi:hypothetical protein
LRHRGFRRCSWARFLEDESWATTAVRAADLVGRADDLIQRCALPALRHGPGAARTSRARAAGARSACDYDPSSCCTWVEGEGRDVVVIASLTKRSMAMRSACRSRVSGAAVHQTSTTTSHPGAVGNGGAVRPPARPGWLRCIGHAPHRNGGSCLHAMTATPCRSRSWLPGVGRPPGGSQNQPAGVARIITFSSVGMT